MVLGGDAGAPRWTAGAGSLRLVLDRSTQAAPAGVAVKVASGRWLVVGSRGGLASALRALRSGGRGSGGGHPTEPPGTPDGA